jgi:hypothetical protein
MCSYGELIGAALERLVGHDLDDEVEMAWPKGSTWVLDVDDGRLRQRHYLPPSASTTLRPATTRANTSEQRKTAGRRHSAPVPSWLAQLVIPAVIPSGPTAPNQTTLNGMPTQPELPRPYWTGLSGRLAVIP